MFDRLKVIETCVFQYVYQSNKFLSYIKWHIISGNNFPVYLEAKP